MIWQGIEIEYAVPMETMRSRGPSQIIREARGLDLDDGRSAFLDGHNGTSEFLRNGGRVYLDRLPTSDIFEISTPECPDPRAAVVYELASDRLAQLASSATPGHHIYKVVETSAPNGEHGVTRGLHESYLVPTDRFRETCEALTPWLVIRQLFCGAGGYHAGDFVRSPRQFHVGKVVSSNTPKDRPLISLDKKNHSPTGRVRLHLTNGEGTRSQLSMLLRQGITTQVIAAVIEGEMPAVPRITDPLELGRRLSAQIAGPWLMHLADGTELDVLDYLERTYLDPLARRATPEEMGVLETAGSIVAELRNGNLEALSRSVEWAIKYELMERDFLGYFDAADSSIGNRMNSNFQFCAISDPTYAELEEDLEFTRIVDDTEIRLATIAPPTDSRGALRVAIAEQLGDRMDRIGWAEILSDGHWIHFPELDGWTPLRRAAFLSQRGLQSQ